MTLITELIISDMGWGFDCSSLQVLRGNHLRVCLTQWYYETSWHPYISWLRQRMWVTFHSHSAYIQIAFVTCQGYAQYLTFTQQMVHLVGEHSVEGNPAPLYNLTKSDPDLCTTVFPGLIKRCKDLRGNVGENQRGAPTCRRNQCSYSGHWKYSWKKKNEIS